MYARTVRAHTVAHTACFNVCTGDIGVSFTHRILLNYGR